MLRTTMLKDFKEFALKGNMIDMAVGIVVGAAFTKVVNSVVTDLLMPPLSLVFKVVNQISNSAFIVLRPGDPWKPPYKSLAEATQAGAVTLNIGSFIDNFVQFAITAFAVFLLVRSINKLRRFHTHVPVQPIAPATRDCPYCLSSVPIKATRCSHCTSDLQPVGSTPEPHSAVI
jgi:large conductance mechanosensitive channel